MQARVPSHVFNGQLDSVLEGKNRFMLGAVVLENPLDIFHSRDAPDIGKKDDYPDNAIHQIEDDVVVADDRCQQFSQVEREQKKQADAETERDGHGAGHGPG